MVESRRLRACKRDFQLQASTLLESARRDPRHAEGISDQAQSDLTPAQVLEDLQGMGTLTSIHDLVRVFAQAGYFLMLDMEELDLDFV